MQTTHDESAMML